MKKFINSIQEGKWDEFLQDWVERRDGLKYEKDANFKTYFGPSGTNYEYWEHISHPVHLRVQSNYDINKLYEIHILTASRKSPDNMWPIVCLIIDEYGFEEIEEFDRFGNSKSGDYIFYLETLFFDPGDYTVTTSGTIGIYANSWYQFVSIDKDGTEHLSLSGYGQQYRLATEDEIEILNQMLFVNNKKWNNKELKLEDINE